MKLTVHMLTGKTLIIEADPSTEVKQLKANLYKHTGEQTYQFYVLLPHANEVWGKVIFLHLSVILFTGGGVPGQVHPPAGPTGQVHPPSRYTTPKRYTPPGRYTPWQVHPPQQVQPRTDTPLASTPPPSNVCWDTVNKRAVRILLECNLVHSKSSCFVFFSFLRKKKHTGSLTMSPLILANFNKYTKPISLHLHQ